MARVPGLGNVWSRLTSGIFGVGLGMAIEPALEPFVEPFTQDAWSSHPTMELDAMAAAQAAVKFPGRREKYQHEAARSGFNKDRFDTLVEIANQAPGASELLDLWRRDLISRDDVAAGLRDALLNEPYISALLKTKTGPLSPADLATARQQGFIDRNRQIHETAESGYDEERAELLFQIAGLPPGAMDGLTLLRRGLIDETTYRKIVAEGHTKTKYTDALLGLRWELVTPSELANGVVQNQISHDDGARIAAEQGIKREDFDLMVRIRGNPPSVLQGLQLLRRGKINEHDFAQIVAESNMKTKYTQIIMEFQHTIPSITQVRLLVHAGAIPDDVAITFLLKGGYDESVAKGVVQAAHASKTAKHRDYSESLILNMYEVRELSRGDAHNFLTQLGYDDGEANFVLDSVEANRRLKYLRAVIEKVHKKFVDAAINEQEAMGLLDSVVPTVQARDEYLTLWREEKEANVKRMTAADIRAALKADIISPGEAFSRLAEIGYPDTDAFVMVSTWFGDTNWSTSGPRPH